MVFSQCRTYCILTALLLPCFPTALCVAHSIVYSVREYYWIKYFGILERIDKSNLMSFRLRKLIFLNLLCTFLERHLAKQFISRGYISACKLLQYFISLTARIDSYHKVHFFSLHFCILCAYMCFYATPKHVVSIFLMPLKCKIKLEFAEH